MASTQKVYVVGAGLSGMVAAINLANAGYQVTVLEAEEKIGGSPLLHPSVHITPINKSQVWDYIGIDLDDCFVNPETFPIYLGNKRHLSYPEYMYLVERGPRSASIDTRLYETALQAGVSFEFGKRVDRVDDLPPQTIIATGLDPAMFSHLGLPYRDIPSRHVYKDSEMDLYGLGIFSEYASEYFYAGVMNELLYCMLPMEDPPNMQHFTRLVHDLKQWENIDIPELEWRPVVFRVPLGGPKNLGLFYEDKILAGTIAGMMDPFFLFGIHGALISGKVAAMTIIDRKAGLQEFTRINRHFLMTYRAKQVYERIPVKIKLALFNAMARYPYLFSPFIQLISRGIPGHDDTEYFYRGFVGPDYEPPLAFRLVSSLFSLVKK